MIGERDSPDGPVEYWACFDKNEVFFLKSIDDSIENDSFGFIESA
jgi:hypothetical protein